MTSLIRLVACMGLLSSLLPGLTRYSGGFSASSFGTVAVGSTSPVTLNISLTSLTAQPSSSLAYGTQFSAGSISCPGIGSVVCTVAVTFAPTQPGLMQDAVLVKDASGNLLRTVEVYGVGQAPRVNLIPGAVSALASVGTHLTGGIAVDAQGNVYFTQDTNTVLKQTPSGTVTVVAGGGTNASASYSGSPTGVQLAQPAGLAIDGAGNLYIADSNNYVVRMIDSASGTLITVAGNGTSGYSGDGGAATSATLKGPTGVAVDVSGNLYISDYVADVIREVGTSGTISTFAGTGTLGYTGDGGAATNARLNRPTGIAIDSQGNFYIADNRNSAIRKVASGIITTIAGNGTAGFSGDGGAAVNAQLNLPSGMALDSTANLYFNDAGNSRIRSISVTTGNIITVAGGGITPIWTLSVSNQVPSTQVNLYGLTGLAIDPAGNLYAASTSGSLNSMFKVTISSSAMDFSATALNQATAAQSVTLWNSGNATLNITPPIAVGGTNSADFTAQTTCGTSVSAGQTCSTSVTFVTAAAAAQAGTLTFTDNANNAANPAATQVVTLNGTVGTPVHVFIDSPGPLLTPFIGNATFSGWAVGGTTAGVTSVALYIDGAPIGTTTNTISRADVCAVYPAQIGCPLVGWSFSVDTTKLTSGPHQVEAVATSTAGLHGSAVTAFYVANWNAGLDPIHIAIDSPSANASFSGTAYFGGWALDDVAGISNVAIAVDGSAMGNAVFGGNRGDVCTSFPNRLGCPNVGWNFALNTTLLADGPHTLDVTATATTGANTTVTAPFTIANLNSNNPIHLSIDTPAANSTALSGVVHVGGWALDTKANTSITRVAVYVGSMFVGNATYGGSRTDVCGVYTGAAGCPNVGWDFELNSTVLTDGMFALNVTAYASDGSTATMSTSFTSMNANPNNPTRVYIDVPSGKSPILTGITTISGWAVNDTSSVTVTRVSILIDGNAYPDATYGNISRPDVCALYPDAGCPNVGWSSVLDTTALANGTHILSVRVTASNGQQNFVRTTFTVANWTATGNPFHVNIDTPMLAGAPLTGSSAAVGGWAVNDYATIATVALAVDGFSVGNAVYGGSRSDVCVAFPNRPGCPNVGWNATFDTTTFADGVHTLDVTVTSSGGQTYTTSGKFRVANLVSPSGIQIGIDIPFPTSAAFSGSAAFGGWAISTNAAVSSVTISVDGAVAGTAVYGATRGDVCTAFGNPAGCPAVGWNFLLDTTQYANGSHTLDVTATDASGHRATSSASFVVSN